MKNRKFITTNPEIYEKLNMINFHNRVFINTSTANQLERIIKNINKKGECLKLTKTKNNYVVEKILNNIHISGYLNKTYHK